MRVTKFPLLPMLCFFSAAQSDILPIVLLSSVNPLNSVLVDFYFPVFHVHTYSIQIYMCLHVVLCFSHWFSAILFFIFNFSKMWAQISPKGSKFEAQTDFVYSDKEFAINGIQPKFLSLLLTGKFCRGVTERVILKRILTSGEYTVIWRLCIA